jgi:hypothetical protein
MRFLVRRTSRWDNEIPPCPEAAQAEYEHYDYWTLPPARIVKMHPHLTNVVKAPGGSRSSRASVGWFVDIDTLDDLLAFHGRHGRVILQQDGANPTELEIYDDYRE